MLFDCFTFFNELELLDIRLHELDSVVDRFVIVESAETFTGRRKPFYFADNAARFAAFRDKIVHVAADAPHGPNAFSRKSDAWAREYHQREQILRGLGSARPGDLVMIGDVDEIPRAAAVREALAQRRPDELTCFALRHYRHCLDRRSIACPTWLLGPRLIERRHVRSPQKVRMTRVVGSRRIAPPRVQAWHTRLANFVRCGMANPVRLAPDAGWHFSSMGDWARFRSKVEAFSHEEFMETAVYQDEVAFARSVAEETELVEMGDMPAFVQAQRERFGDLLWS